MLASFHDKDYYFHTYTLLLKYIHEFHHHLLPSPNNANQLNFIAYVCTLHPFRVLHNYMLNTYKILIVNYMNSTTTQLKRFPQLFIRADKEITIRLCVPSAAILL